MSVLLFISFAILLFSHPHPTRADLRTRLSQAGVDATFPGDATFTTIATPFNKRLEFIPAAIAFPESVGMWWLFHPEIWGHSYAAYGLGGASGHLVVDLSRMKNISVDASTGHAAIQTGNRLGDIAIALNDAGRALPHGTCAYVGVGGHAAYGGYGFTSRQSGLTLDTIVAHDVVLANGSVVTTSSDSTPDLFFALAGAAPSFGIVTTIYFATYPVPASATRFIYKWDLDVSATASAIMAWQNYTLSGAPKEFGGDMDFGKGSQQGQIAVTVQGVFYADPASFAGVVQPLLSALPAAASQTVTAMDWITSLQNTAGNQPLSSQGYNLSGEHDTFYTKSLTTPSSAPMSTAAMTAFANYLANDGFAANLAWFVQFEMWGGPTSRILQLSPSTSFAQRAQIFTIQFYASSPNFAPPYPDAGFGFLDNMVASIVSAEGDGWPYGSYVNYIDDKEVDWKERYFGENYDRLSQIKAVYDPANLFTFAQGITGTAQNVTNATSTSLPGASVSAPGTTKVSSAGRVRAFWRR